LSQSSGTGKALGDNKATRASRGLEPIIARLGFAGALALFGGLWFQRTLIAEARPGEILALAAIVLGAAVILTAIVTALVIVPLMAGRSGELAEVLGAASQGDLSREVPGHALDADEARLSDSVRDIVHSMRDLVRSQRHATQVLSSHANDVSLHAAGALTVAQRSTEASSSNARLGESVASLSRELSEVSQLIGGTTTQLAGHAEYVRQREARLKDLSVSGSNRLRNGAEDLEELASGAAQVSQDFAALAEDSSEIRSFVVLVRKMARQSKLLALNAAMEAARAGEHGSGFAVVAGEVRRLARSSAEAADRTDDLVTAVLERLGSIRDGQARTAELTSRAKKAVNVGVTALEQMDRVAVEASKGAASVDDDVTSLRAMVESMALRLQQLTRESEQLDEALREASTNAGSQQARIQELTVASAALARSAAKAHASLTGIRTEPVAPDATAPEGPGAAPTLAPGSSPELAA
jgi:methyl-accepting chemotaxis protein